MDVTNKLWDVGT